VNISLPAQRSLLLLAPPGTHGSGRFRNLFGNYSMYSDLQAEMQRLRGRMYSKDGAIGEAELSPDGRHVLPTDDHSWHLLMLGRDGAVQGCARYLMHPSNVNFEDLRVRNAALADSDVWGTSLRAAVEEQLGHARRRGFAYVEFGGWALDHAIRSTAQCLRSVLATYAWARLVGGAFGISTATERNGSASILRRLGGRSFEWEGASLPPYFDPSYNCRMEMLHFDSRRPNPKYEVAISEFEETMIDIPVICPERPSWRTIVRGFSPIVEHLVPEYSIPEYSMVLAGATA
jgi:hypothetical protein